MKAFSNHDFLIKKHYSVHAVTAYMLYQMYYIQQQGKLSHLGMYTSMKGTSI